LKEQEKKKQPKPFYAGSAKVLSTAKPANIVTNKPLTRLQMKNATKAFSSAQSRQPRKQTKTTGALRKLSLEIKLFYVWHYIDAVTKKQKDAVKERNPPVIKNKKNPLSKPPPPEQNKSTVQPTNAKGKPVVECQIDEAWISTAKKPKKAVTGTDFDKAFQSDKVLSPFRFGGVSMIQSPKFTFNMKAKAGRSATFVTKSRGCPASPLCFHYKAAEDLMRTPQQEMSEEVLPLDSLATVKRNAFHDSNSVVNCNDSVLLQPSKQQSLFHDSDSGNVRDGSGSSSSDGDDSGSEDKGSQADNKDTKTEDEQQVISEDSSAMLVSEVAGATPKSQEVQRFKDLHSTTVGRLTELCVMWEKKIDELNSTASSDNEEGKHSWYQLCLVMHD